MENTIDNGRIVIHSVGFTCPSIGQSKETFLHAPVVLDGISARPAGLCRMCAGRMQLPLLSRLILVLALDSEELGVPFRYNYGDLGLQLGRCGHSVKEAVAVLRRTGLVTTARTEVSGVVAISASPFMVWASGVLRKSGLIDWQPACQPEPQITLVPPAVSLIDALVPKAAESVSKNGESVSKDGEGVSKKRKGVSKTRKPRTQPEQPTAKKEGTHLPQPPAVQPAVTVPGAESAPEEVAYATEAEAIAASVARLKAQYPELPPGCYIDENVGALAFDGNSGYPVPPMFQAADDDPVDNSEEVAGTLRAAGRTAGRTTGDDDEDEFSLGSDTAETDMGHGVKINPDI